MAILRGNSSTVSKALHSSPRKTVRHIKIDPNNVNKAEQQLLGRVFLKYSHKDVFSKDEIFEVKGVNCDYKVKLSTAVIKRQRSKLGHEQENRFEPLLTRLGAGAFGDTFNSGNALAVNPLDKRATVANDTKKRVLKEIKRKPNESVEDFKARVNNEYKLAKLAGKLSPKQPVFFTGGGEDIAVLVMRKVGDYSLSELLAQNPQLSSEERYRLSYDVLQAIEELNNKGIIHRDLKPDNIRVSYKNGVFTVIIVDFGLAKLAEEEKQNPSTRLYGSMLHSAPEVLKECKYSPASDVFSAGKVLWEIWGGKESPTPDSVRKIKDKNKRAFELRKLTYKENLNKPLEGLFTGLTVSQLDQDDISAQLNRMTHNNPITRGSSLQSYIEEFKMMMGPKFFREHIGKQIMNSLATKSKDCLKEFLSKVDESWFTDNNEENKLKNSVIKSVIDYLKEALLSSSFFATARSLTKERMQQAYEILTAIKNDQIDSAVKMVEEIKDGIIFESRMKKTIEKAVAPVTAGCHFAAQKTFSFPSNHQDLVIDQSARCA